MYASVYAGKEREKSYGLYPLFFQGDRQVRKGRTEDRGYALHGALPGPDRPLPGELSGL